jgi:hypothetical protein
MAGLRKLVDVFQKEGDIIYKQIFNDVLQTLMKVLG